MAINKKLYLLLPLSALFIILSYHFYKDNAFLYDDAPESLSYYDSSLKSCPNEFSFIKRSSFPKLVLNIFGNCLPILHTERSGAFVFDTIHFLNSFFSKKNSLVIFKMTLSLLLLILYLNLTIKFSERLRISPVMSTLLFFFSPYFFFLYEPYLIEKSIPLAIVATHLLLFSKHNKANLLAGLFSALCLFFIKMTFLFELIPVWILHFSYFKNKDLKKYTLGFLIGLIPLLIFNFAMFSKNWMFLTQDVTAYSSSIFQSLPLFLEFIFIPSSFYINGLFFQPEYLELTEYLPLVALTTSLIISTTYAIKKRNSFTLHLFACFILCFIASYLLVMSKAKSNSMIYISSLGLYIPLLINFGFTRFQENNFFQKGAQVIQLALVLVFSFTLLFQIPQLDIISNKGVIDYIKVSEILTKRKIKGLVVDDFEKLNAKYLIPEVDLSFPKTYKEVSSRNGGFAILTSDLMKFHSYLETDSSLKKFKRESLVVNKEQNIILYLFVDHL